MVEVCWWVVSTDDSLGDDAPLCLVELLLLVLPHEVLEAPSELRHAPRQHVQLRDGRVLVQRALITTTDRQAGKQTVCLSWLAVHRPGCPHYLLGSALLPIAYLLQRRLYEREGGKGGGGQPERHQVRRRRRLLGHYHDSSMDKGRTVSPPRSSQPRRPLCSV